MTHEEQQALAWLEDIHQKSLKMFPNLSEQEIINIAKTNGDVPDAAMKAYCDNHNSPYPFWIK